MQFTSSVYKTFAGCILALSALAQPALAADKWPTKPVQMVVPIDTGTTKDAIARRLASSLSDMWGQPVVVVNQSGGAGAVGHQTIATSTPDGHTIGYISASLTGSLVTRNNLPFTRDKLSGVTKFGHQDFVLFVNKDAPFNTLQEMVSYAKSNPGKLTYATPGVGSYAHLTMEHLATVEQTTFTHVPYKVFMQSVPDVASGRVQMVITVANSALDGQVTNGNMKVIGSLTKNSMYRGAPVQSISSIRPDVAAGGYYGIVVAAGTPAAIVDKIHKDVSTIVTSAEFRQYMMSLSVRSDSVAQTDGPREFDRWIDQEISRLKRIIQQANIRFE
jgi:tripartite-type tricarboxylate transporter receptor subunit TctC